MEHGMMPQNNMSQDSMPQNNMPQNNMSQNSMSHGGMMSYFHTSVQNTILFQGWHTMTWQELLGSCIGVAIIAALYEAFKVGRDLLDIRMSKASKQSYKVAETQCECNVTDQTSTKTTGDSTVIAIGDYNEVKKHKTRPDIISLRHIVQTGLHFVQLWIGFCLMLIFMTFSVYLCLAITVGGAVGYFCFAWMRNRLHSDHPSEKSECCN